jgi:hypothetical protein
LRNARASYRHKPAYGRTQKNFYQPINLVATIGRSEREQHDDATILWLCSALVMQASARVLLGASNNEGGHFCQPNTPANRTICGLPARPRARLRKEIHLQDSSVFKFKKIKRPNWWDIISGLQSDKPMC